jgi:5'(3')-deoxyribonucleotidase
MKICFDMDGTIADLYGVDNWLAYLEQEDETPYRQAAVLLNMNVLARTLNKLQKKGYKIGIVSWLSKNSTADYDTKVTAAKKAWLVKHLHSVHFDFVEIVRYGTPKSFVATSDEDILFDDEPRNREEWTGKAYDVHNILEVLRALP